MGLQNQYSMNRLKFIYTFCIVFLSLAASCSEEIKKTKNEIKADVCIYGATPAGIASAISASKLNKSVILIEPTIRIGGMTTNGLSHTDFHSFEALTGTFLDFTQRVENYYSNQYGENSNQVKDSFRGTFGEPKVNLMIFQEMLAEQPNITVIKEAKLSEVQVFYSKILSAEFKTGENILKLQAEIFIDATYEGDLMAMAGVSFTVGREGKDIYNESLAPDTTDNQLQAYNFRFCATDDPTNRVEVKQPNGYDRNDFVEILPILESGVFDKVFGYPPQKAIYKAHLPVNPNNKFDINDMSKGIVRLSLPGKNLGWPDGSPEQRKVIFKDHLYHNVGLLYFLQNDSEVPEKYRTDAKNWGWCKDEFVENDHLPLQLYVREARRMIGQHIYIQKDSEPVGEDSRAVFHESSIAMGDYGNNCHGTHHVGPLIGGMHEGEFYNPVPPYQVPYGVLLPKEVNNLLVPVAISSSHVGFCALRLEPIWTSLGQAAGFAAALAIDSKKNPDEIEVDILQETLHEDGSATIYVGDVLPGDPDFVAVQWWGAQGGLHQLNTTSKPGQRGKNIVGQYYEVAPLHDVNLDKIMEPETKERWIAISRKIGIQDEDLNILQQMEKRGNFIREAYNLIH